MNALFTLHKRAWLVLLSGWALAASPVTAGGDGEDYHNDFAQALERALSDPAVPAVLEVQCTDEKGIRGFSLYASGTLIWGQRSQARADPALRQALLEALKRAGFASFDPLYGGEGKPAETKAPLQVYCRVAAEIDSQRKSSGHATGGVKFEPLLRLAADLLNRAETVGSQGVTAEDFSDALTKLADGSLAAETLTLRLTRLHLDAGAQAGVILRMQAGDVARTAYRPGAAAVQPEWRPATAAELTGTVAALSEARFSSLPVNVPGLDMEELEVVVLDHRHTVSARPFTRIAPGELADERMRFSRLVDALLKMTGSE